MPTVIGVGPVYCPVPGGGQDTVLVAEEEIKHVSWYNVNCSVNTVVFSTEKCANECAQILFLAMIKY